MSVNGSKVLVVDDDAALAEMLQIVLEKQLGMATLQICSH